MSKNTNDSEPDKIIKSYGETLSTTIVNGICSHVTLDDQLGEGEGRALDYTVQICDKIQNMIHFPSPGSDQMTMNIA